MKKRRTATPGIAQEKRLRGCDVSSAIMKRAILGTFMIDTVFNIIWCGGGRGETTSVKIKDPKPAWKSR